MINETKAKLYCVEDISLIENYEKAIADKTQTWHCHHRKETDEGLSKQELIDKRLYVARPACELVFLTPGEHISLHGRGVQHKMAVSGELNPMYGKHHSEESKRKISETRKERIANGEIIVDLEHIHTDEVYAKISLKAKERYQDKCNHPMYGKHLSEEARKKISEAHKGRKLSEQHKLRISEGTKAAMTEEVRGKISKSLEGNSFAKGKHWKCKPRTKPAWNKGKKLSEEHKAKLRGPKSEEHKAKMSAARKGKVWANDGSHNKIFSPDAVPEGWTLGMI